MAPISSNKIPTGSRKIERMTLPGKRDIEVVHVQPKAKVPQLPTVEKPKPPKKEGHAFKVARKDEKVDQKYRDHMFSKRDFLSKPKGEQKKIKKGEKQRQYRANQLQRNPDQVSLDIAARLYKRHNKPVTREEAARDRQLLREEMQEKEEFWNTTRLRPTAVEMLHMRLTLQKCNFAYKPELIYNDNSLYESIFYKIMDLDENELEFCPIRGFLVLKCNGMPPRWNPSKISKKKEKNDKEKKKEERKEKRAKKAKKLNDDLNHSLFRPDPVIVTLE